MQAEQNYLTAEGREKLRKELDSLLGSGRENIASRLRAAIQQGDLSENADYISTKEEQGFLEGRIADLAQLLKNAVIIDDMQRDNSIVNIGNAVTIREVSGETETFFMVGPKEADPKNGRISYLSPIGKALLGHKSGEKVIIEIPDGKIEVTILQIT